MTGLEWCTLWRRLADRLAYEVCLDLAFTDPPDLKMAGVRARLALRADERRSEALHRHMAQRVLIADGGPIREEVQP